MSAIAIPDCSYPDCRLPGVVGIQDGGACLDHISAIMDDAFAPVRALRPYLTSYNLGSMDDARLVSLTTEAAAMLRFAALTVREVDARLSESFDAVALQAEDIADRIPDLIAARRAQEASS